MDKMEEKKTGKKSRHPESRGGMKARKKTEIAMGIALKVT